jgi:RNA polymerase sigma-70 factor (ECF subfamily)
MADGEGRPLDASVVRRFEALALPQADAAYNLALRLTRQAEAAEDVVHDAFLRALTGFERFRGGDGRAWLLRIVRNRAFDWLREQKLKRAVPLGGDDMDDPDWDISDPDQQTPEEVLMRKGTAAGVHAVLNALPPRLREVLVLREMEELSYREIAEITEAPIGTVMSRLARARSLAAERLVAMREARR